MPSLYWYSRQACYAVLQSWVSKKFMTGCPIYERLCVEIFGEWFIKRMPFVKHIYSASKQISAVVFPDQNTTVLKEVAIICHPFLGEYAFDFITSSVVFQVNKSSVGEASTAVAAPKCCLSNVLVLKEVSHYCLGTRMICAASVYFMLLMQELMLPVVISYVNAAIDTTAIGFKRRS
uniref:Uncharacterized protein n=1 Tax=Tanacetum cinerariifolium TaxID=118510 RepID=A0A6L2LD11_TANCI|nr:hypothetical protein [Tanacetum cinerariifolium]